jgi:FAD:protein FMN transferase
MLALAAILAAMAGCASRPAELRRFTYEQPQMGVPFRIILYAPNASEAEEAAKAAFGRISELNDVLSDYDTDSELSRLSQTSGHQKQVRVSEDLWRILARSQKLARESGGAFDITAGPIVSQWRKARRERKLPEPGKIEEAKARSGHDKLELNGRSRTAELLVPYMRLDMGAIAKGYAVDEGLEVLRRRGFPRALVSGAGDMAAGEPPPGKCGWRVALAPHDASNAPPVDFVSLRNNALATSGDIFQHVEIDGARYSHIVDPRTGFGLTDRSLVVVIARSCTTADSLSTAISVLGAAAGLPLAERYGACARMLRMPAANVEISQSPCFERFRIAPGQTE